MIEDESQKAFARLFATENWVIRRLADDYGRDLEVELFADGQATGILFGVQLKATDKVAKNHGISLPGIKASSLNY